MAETTTYHPPPVAGTAAMQRAPPLGFSPGTAPISSVGWPAPDWRTKTLGGSGVRRSSQGPTGPGSFVPSPSFINSYATSWPTNYQVPYARITKPFKNDALRAPHRGHLVITRRGRVDEITPRGEKPERRYIMMSVPEFNYYLASEEKKGLTAREVWSDWVLDGVVRSEEGQDDEDWRRGVEANGERLLNVMIRGYAHVADGWGHELFQGTKLWLLLKRSRVEPLTYVLGTKTRQTRLRPEGNEDRTKWPHQLSFYANPLYDAPPDSELMYDDEDGVRTRGMAIFVGTVDVPKSSGVRAEELHLDRDFPLLTAQPRIYIFLDPN